MPDISDEELRDIQSGIEKAIVTEKKNKSFLASIGPAIVGILKPLFDKVSMDMNRLPGEVSDAVAKVKVPKPPPSKAAEKADPSDAAPAAPAAPAAEAAPAAQAAPAAEAAPAAKAAPAAPASKVVLNNSALIKEIKQMSKAISEQKTPFMPSKMEVNFSKPQSVVVTDALGKPMLGPMGGGGGGGGPSNVHVKEIFGSAGASVITPDGRLKTELASGGGGLTDTELRASAVEVIQVSGATDSVSVVTTIGLTDTELRASTLDVKQVSGSVDSVVVNSQVPGTGATNLGKAIDDPVGSTDTGVMVLGVHDGEASKITPDEEDFDHLHIGELGGLSVEPEQHNHLDEMDSTSGWAALGNDTLNLNTTTNHLTGTAALTFDKVDGDANTIFAGIEKTITTLNMGELDLHDLVQTACYLSSLSNIVYVFIRVGSDSSNYNEWRIPVSELTADEWTVLGVVLGNASKTGNTANGVNWVDIKYIAVGVAFDAETRTLSGIIFDQLGLFTNHHTVASLAAEVSTTVNTAKIDLQKINGSVTDKGSGNASNGSQRIVIATDDVNQAAIKTATEATQAAVEIMDDWDETNRAAVNPISSVTGIAGGTGADATNVTRVSLATDIALPAGTNSIGDIGTVAAVTGITDSLTAIIGDKRVDEANGDSNPLGMGGVARTANPTAVGNGDRVASFHSDVGMQVMRPIQVRDLLLTAYVTLSNGTETDLLDGVSGQFHDLVYIMASNDSGAAVNLDIRSGTANDIMMTIEVPAAGTAGVAPPVPIPQNEADQAWTVDMADITGTNISVTGLFTNDV